VDDLSAAMPYQEQAVQNPEVECDHGEEIHASNHFPVVFQKSSPQLTAPSRRCDRARYRETGRSESRTRALTIHHGWRGAP